MAVQQPFPLDLDGIEVDVTRDNNFTAPSIAISFPWRLHEPDMAIVKKFADEAVELIRDTLPGGNKHKITKPTPGHGVYRITASPDSTLTHDQLFTHAQDMLREIETTMHMITDPQEVLDTVRTDHRTGRST